ncbi:16 kDa beta-galactoside-binding lectin-like [Hemicordylus capensis]|uniref:16 kDa beta-galactoside-binding lectin-like n=1 Tax=Hemicordylus capensis TaxID=884348 RepID=UPI0023025D97|nr:16 kDa beta-galactoside-binding lectin-like [Hemicordylus capensis]
MQHRLTATGLNIHLENGFQLRGSILPDAKDFLVDLGKDPDNIGLRFHVHFASDDAMMNTVVCNSKQDGVWGEEAKTSLFPFQRGSRVKIIFSFHSSNLMVKVEEAPEMVRVRGTPARPKLIEGSFLKLDPLGVVATHYPSQWNLEVYFFNRMGLKAIQYFSVEGDFKIKGLKYIGSSLLV